MDAYLLETIYTGSLIFIRFLGFFVIAPIFANEVIPNRIKLSICFLMAIILTPLINQIDLTLPEHLLILASELIIELLIGFMIGFIMLLVFFAIQLAGEFIDRRMGFFLANVMDPQHGLQVPLIGQFKNILAILFFFAIDAHHYLLKVVVDSFEIVELTNVNLSEQFLPAILRTVGDLFPIALRISLPVMATLFIVDLAFGLVARTVPQMNVFIIGLPTKILVGLILLGVSMANYFTYLDFLIEDTFQKIYQILNLMG